MHSALPAAAAVVLAVPGEGCTDGSAGSAILSAELWDHTVTGWPRMLNVHHSFLNLIITAQQSVTKKERKGMEYLMTQLIHINLVTDC